MNYRILGISASLRNARRGLGNDHLVRDILNLNTKEELLSYIEQEAAAHLQNFVEAGRHQDVPFDVMYTNLKKLKGNRGLSNSEIALVTALWSVKQKGGEIDHISLSEYFTESYQNKDVEELRRKLLEADGFIVSTPVYFGDRGSLSQSLIDLIKSDDELRDSLEGKTYAGIAVGAKRNGGQETTLIYQLLDMVNIGLLGMGNDSDTTSQYGGTGWAGDIGTMPKDSYGIGTSMGTGRRIANVTHMLKYGHNLDLSGKTKILFWILQDKEGTALDFVKNLIVGSQDLVEAKILDIINHQIIRCLACDICPTHIDIDEEYRCIINSKKDDFRELHQDLLFADAIIPVAFSPMNRDRLMSNYQRFIERTRYLRRGDYLFSDLVTAPIVVEDVGASENLALRMMTSTIRHHTLVSRPIVGYRHNNKLINESATQKEFQKLVDLIIKVTLARIESLSNTDEHTANKYNPVGYVLSVSKDQEDEKLNKRAKMVSNRLETAKKMMQNRVIIKDNVSSH